MEVRRLEAWSSSSFGRSFVRKEALGGVPDGEGVGLLQGAGGVGGLDREVPEVADGLHQGAAQEGAACEVHGQSQVPACGLRVELARAVNDETAHAVLQQGRIPPEGGEQRIDLRAEAVRRKGEGGEDGCPRPQLLRRDGEGIGDAGKALRKDPVQSGGAGGRGGVQRQLRHG